MSQVHNKTLNYALQPLFLLTGTLLACRFIQHFPNTSRKALLLAGTVGTGAAFASSWKAPKYETSLHSSLRVIAWLALGIITTYALAKVLKGRVQLSLKGAALFAAIEAGEVAALTGISSIVTSKYLSYEEYRDKPEYRKVLSTKDHRNLLKRSYDDSHPSLIFTLSDFDAFNYEVSEFLDPDNVTLSTLSKEQLIWQRDHYLLTRDYHTYSFEYLFNLNRALSDTSLMCLQTYKIEPWLKKKTKNPEDIDLLYTFLKAEPFHPSMLELLKDLFKDKPPLPSMKEYFQGLTEEKIVGFNQRILIDIHYLLRSSANFNKLSENQQIWFNTAFGTVRGLWQLKISVQEGR